MGSSSESEGEIIETKEDLKAISGPPTYAKDRQIDRRSYSITPTSPSPPRSPLRHNRRSPSPFRHSRGGEKRKRNDKRHDAPRDRSLKDPRIYRTYDDLDQPNPDGYVNGHPGHAWRDARNDANRERKRSRSPWRPGKGSKADALGSRHASKEPGTREPSKPPTFVKAEATEPEPKRVKFDPTAKPPAVDPEPDVVVPEPVDEEAEIERRRRERQAKREALLNKSKPSALLTQALNVPSLPESAPATPPMDTPDLSSRQVTPAISAPSTPRSAPNSPMMIDDLTKELEGLGDDVEEPSAAMYDPTMDDEDRARHEAERENHDAANTYDEAEAQRKDVQIPVEPTPTDAKAEDMFADDSDDDMFANDKPIKATKATKDVAIPAEGMALAADLHDSWDTPDGFYKTIVGELIDNRYVVKAALGKGVFATVIRAHDTEAGRLVAIKIVRNNEAMRKAGLKEIDILQRLAQADADDQFHIVRLHRHFVHKNHLCMVFENLGSNLRDLVKNFGRKTGLELQVVRSYAVQIFKALVLLRKSEILHADLKPDNILSDAGHGKKIKVADLGSATTVTENEITPYLASRYYRAPEVMLGIPPSYPIDVWAIGCTLFELYTDAMLFQGRTNNDMLKIIQECRGKISKKIIRRGVDALKYANFDPNLEKFAFIQREGIPPKDTIGWINFGSQPLPGKDLKTRLLKAASKKGTKTADNLRELEDFRDLLDKCLKLDPEERITPRQALMHKFCSGRPAATTKSGKH